MIHSCPTVFKDLNNEYEKLKLVFKIHTVQQEILWTQSFVKNVSNFYLCDSLASQRLQIASINVRGHKFLQIALICKNH